MTDYALRILALPAATPEDLLDKAGLDTPVVQGLSLHARDCGPYGLSGWAEPRGHRLYHVDNSWVRARVRGRDLPAFFAEVLRGEPKLGPGIQPDAEYLIEAEEY